MEENKGKHAKGDSEVLRVRERETPDKGTKKRRMEKKKGMPTGTLTHVQKRRLKEDERKEKQNEQTD